jgi:hypothetical protein
MRKLKLQCLKNKGELVAHVANARHVAMNIVNDMHEILDWIEQLNRAVIFEKIDEIKSISKILRLGSSARSGTYVEGYEGLIDTLNTATAKCSRAKSVPL